MLYNRATSSPKTKVKGRGGYFTKTSSNTFLTIKRSRLYIFSLSQIHWIQIQTFAEGHSEKTITWTRWTGLAFISTFYLFDLFSALVKIFPKRIWNNRETLKHCWRRRGVRGGATLAVVSGGMYSGQMCGGRFARRLCSDGLLLVTASQF